MFQGFVPKYARRAIQSISGYKRPTIKFVPSQTKPFYRVGDVIEGEVILDVPETTLAASINLKVQGYERVHWEEQQGKSNKIIYEKKHFFDSQKCVWPTIADRPPTKAFRQVQGGSLTILRSNLNDR